MLHGSDTKNMCARLVLQRGVAIKIFSLGSTADFAGGGGAFGVGTRWLTGGKSFITCFGVTWRYPVLASWRMTFQDAIEIFLRDFG